MSIFIRVLVGFIIIAVGFGMVWKTEVMLQIMGRNWWAERTFGAGGSRTYYKLWGMAIALLGIVVATDLFDRIVGTFITNVFTP